MKRRPWTWFVFHEVAIFFGLLPALFLQMLKKVFRIPFAFRTRERDLMDVWSLGHAFTTAVIFCFFFGLGVDLGKSWLISQGIMLAYEAIIDGFRIEDPWGISVGDLGWNFIGATLTWLALGLGQELGG